MNHVSGDRVARIVGLYLALGTFIAVIPMALQAVLVVSQRHVIVWARVADFFVDVARGADAGLSTILTMVGAGVGLVVLQDIAVLDSVRRARLRQYTAQGVSLLACIAIACLIYCVAAVAVGRLRPGEIFWAVLMGAFATVLSVVVHFVDLKHARLQILEVRLRRQALQARRARVGGADAARVMAWRWVLPVIVWIVVDVALVGAVIVIAALLAKNWAGAGAFIGSLALAVVVITAMAAAVRAIALSVAATHGAEVVAVIIAAIPGGWLAAALAVRVRDLPALSADAIVVGVCVLATAIPWISAPRSLRGLDVDGRLRAWVYGALSRSLDSIDAPEDVARPPLDRRPDASGI